MSGTREWHPGQCVQVRERGQVIFDILDDPDPERGPVPSGVLMTIAWAEGRMQSEVLWFPDFASANQYGREDDDDWQDDVGGDFARDSWYQYGSPVTLYAYDGA